MVTIILHVITPLLFLILKTSKRLQNYENACLFKLLKNVTLQISNFISVIENMFLKFGIESEFEFQLRCVVAV